MTRRLRSNGVRGVFLILAALLFSPIQLNASPNQGIDQQATYEASVQRTDGGIPHISAADFASVGFGTGYAMAEDLICLLADERFLTFSAERSKFLGEGGGNLQSDFFYQLFIDRGEAEEPVDPRQAALFRGAAAGYNRYLRDTGVDNISDESCRGQEWVREIGEIDWRRVSRMNFFLPFVSGLITAASPPAPLAATATPGVLDSRLAPGRLTAVQASEIQVAWNEIMKPFKREGSNAVGLGATATVGGRGMLGANPHFPWTGTSRFYAFHQLLAGEYNVIGANIVGRPQIGIGTNEHVAWTSTVSTASRNTFYLLTLVPGNPTQYFFDGVPTDMIQETVTVQVPDGNGGFEDRTHTYYSTHYGAFLVGGPFPWNDFVAFAVRPTLNDWRGTNLLVAQFQSRSVRDLKAVHDAGQFLPVNLIAADSSGEALYAEPGSVPHLTDAQLAECARPGALNGSSSACMWGTDADAAVPGIWGPDNLPSLIRTDYVANSNDTSWLANPNEPLTGFNSNLGVPGSEQTLRTRFANQMVKARLAGTDGLGDPGFTLDQLQHLVLANENYASQILRDDVVTLCEANPSVTLPDLTVVDISAVCPVLAAWDLRDNLDSRGVQVFREMIAEAGGRGSRRLPTTFNYAVPFDASDPLNTPRGLDTTDNPAVLEALALAVQKLGDAGIALDARLGDIQFVVRNGETIPIHGGPESTGVFNKVTAGFIEGEGYAQPDSGSTWIQATEFTADGPTSRGLLTYSLSPNPASPHYSDQTKKFSSKEWVDLPYTRSQVDAAAVSGVELKEGKRDCKKGGWQAFENPSFSNQGACVKYFNALRKSRLDEIKARKRANRRSRRHGHGKPAAIHSDD